MRARKSVRFAQDDKGSGAAGTKFAHIQVKTYRPGDRTCIVGMKAERNYGRNFF
jgi:hypothetical protein